MYNLTPNKKKSRWKGRSFGNARNVQKLLLSPLFCLNWDFARGIMGMPVHILHSISLLSQHIEPSNLYLSSRNIFLFLFFVGWHYLLLAIQALRDSSKMARPLFAIFLWTRQYIKKVVHHVFLELHIENFKILSMLFQLVLKISRFFQCCSATYTLLLLGNEDAAASSAISAAQKVILFPKFLQSAGLVFSNQHSEWTDSLQNLRAHGRILKPRFGCNRHLYWCQEGNLLSYHLLCLFELANDHQNPRQRKFSRRYDVVARVLFKWAAANPCPSGKGSV